MAPKSQTILTVLQGIYRYVKKIVGGLISAVGGVISAWRSFFRPTEKKWGLYFRLGGFFPGIHFFATPGKKNPGRKTEIRFFALFSGVILSGGLFSFGLFSVTGLVGRGGYGGLS